MAAIGPHCKVHSTAKTAELASRCQHPPGIVVRPTRSLLQHSPGSSLFDSQRSRPRLVCPALLCTSGHLRHAGLIGEGQDVKGRVRAHGRTP